MSTQIRSCSDEVILSFFDTLIHQRDLDLLKGPYWINDVLIGFFYEYLEKHIYSEFRSEVCLLHPDVVFACASSDVASAAELTKELKLHEKNLVFLPINNNHDVSQDGGTHWSLLFYDRIKNTFYALDSLSDNNARIAESTARTMTLALGIPDLPEFVHEVVPQQSNGYDCGLYVLVISAKLLLQKNIDISNVTNDYVTAKRQEVHDLILYLREIF